MIWKTDIENLNNPLFIFSKRLKRSRNILGIILLIFQLSSSTATAQTAMKVHNYYFYYNDYAMKPTLTISTFSKIKERLFFSTYTIVRPSWGQSMLGLDVAVTDWMIAGFKIGIQTESNGTMERYSPIVFINKNRWNIFGVYEWGGINDRSQGMLCYRVKHYNFGIMEAHSGKLVAIGPMFEFTIPKTIFTVYGSALTVLEDGKFASQFGIYMRFLPKPSIFTFPNKKTAMAYDMPVFHPIN